MKRYAVATAALLACGAALADGPEFKFSGFGTIAAVHSNSDQADFVGTLYQPNGAGRTDSWSFGPDSKLGGQVNAVFTPKWSAVLQLVAQHQYNNSYNPMVEWANVKYQATDEFSVRVGRIAMPSYLLSESRFVGYSNPWVRPPHEAYGVLAITSNDGIDGTYRSKIGNANNSFQAYYGTSTSKIPNDGKFQSHPGWGLSDSVDIGSLTLRAGYTSVKLDTNIPSFAPLFAGLQTAASFGVIPSSLVQKYRPNDWKLSAVSLGANYDPGNWFLMSEVIEFKGDSLLSDSTTWYVSGGYRFGAFTPYVTVGGTKAHVTLETDPVGATIVNQALQSTTATQRTASVGIRWDFMKNMALKAQYDKVNAGSNSNGKFVVPQTNTTFKGSSVDLITVALDFVF
jgi:opacity protein-like surface antigen